VNLFTCIIVEMSPLLRFIHFLYEKSNSRLPRKTLELELELWQLARSSHHHLLKSTE